MFDLPVIEPEERKKAAKFRKFLLDEGFSMSQFSVYSKYVGPRKKIESQVNRIKNKLPKKGKVCIISFTDLQYKHIINLVNAEPDNPDASKQLLLDFG